MLWMHRRHPRSTVKVVLPSNETFESKTSCNSVPLQPYFRCHWSVVHDKKTIISRRCIGVLWRHKCHEQSLICSGACYVQLLRLGPNLHYFWEQPSERAFPASDYWGLTRVSDVQGKWQESEGIPNRLAAGPCHTTLRTLPRGPFSYPAVGTRDLEHIE